MSYFLVADIRSGGRQADRRGRPGPLPGGDRAEPRRGRGADCQCPRGGEDDRGAEEPANRKQGRNTPSIFYKGHREIETRGLLGTLPNEVLTIFQIFKFQF